MRVAIATGQLAAPFSGVGTYARTLARGLRARGISVTVYCPRGQSLSDLPCHEFPVWVPRHHGRWLCLAAAFARALRRHEADLVHFVDARECLWCPGSSPIVGTIQDYYFSRPSHYLRFRRAYPDWPARLAYSVLTRTLEARAYARASALIANSSSTASRAAQAYRLKAVPRVIHLPLAERKRPAFPREDAILFVGGNPYRKGLARLIAGLSELPSQVELWVAGCRIPPPLVRLARRKGVEDRIRAWGLVGQETLDELYGRAKVLALPGVTEALGLVFLEATAAGCAVIGPSDGGAGEIIEDGVSGFLVPFHDDELLVQRLRLLLEREEVRQAMVREGTRRLARFGTSPMLDATLEVYREVLGGGRP